MKKPKSKPEPQPTPEPSLAKRRVGVPVPVVLLLLGAAFGVGVVLNQGRDRENPGSRPGVLQTQPPVVPAGTKPGTGVTLTPPPPAGPQPPAGQPPQAPPPETPVPGDKPGTAVRLPPYTPPSLGSGRQGEGEVVDFYDPYKGDPEGKAKYEAARQKAWEERLSKENARLVALMNERLGLTPGQTDEVKRVLADQTAARQELIKQLVAGNVPRTDMEDRVKAIKAQTEDRLKKAMTPGQWDAYVKLDPKDQPTNPDVAGPR